MVVGTADQKLMDDILMATNRVLQGERLPAQAADRAARCRAAINFQETLHTRCRLAAGHAGSVHLGKGQAQFPYQNIEWLPFDRRCYETERDDDYAWEE